MLSQCTCFLLLFACFFFFHIVVRQVILVFDSLISFYDFYVFKQSVKSFSQSVVSLVGRSVRSVIESVTLSSGLSVNPYLSLSVYHSVSPSAVVDSVRQSLGQLANQMVDQSVHPQGQSTLVKSVSQSVRPSVRPLIGQSVSEDSQ